jgi:hypothetical protein
MVKDAKKYDGTYFGRQLLDAQAVVVTEKIG